MNFDLHPQIIHFPIVLITVAFVLQLVHILKKYDHISWQSYYFALAGLVSGFASAISGERAEESLENIGSNALKAIERHELLANITIWALLTVMIGWGYYLGKKKFDKRIELLILTVLFILSATVLITGHLGGRLVYNHGLGINLP